MSQDDLMLKDECIVVNYMDDVIGHDNKYNCHKFIPGQPRGILHRAFSVMLFDASGKMLVQQRAASKITFPNVWANTCCSHPLYGMSPSEVDTPKEVAAGTHMGVKHAAIRKLGHELGIPAEELDATRFKFITRVHYWAADVLSHGPASPWGEHEIDHLLLYQLAAGEALTLNLNPDEVQAVQWYGREELLQAFGRRKSLPALSDASSDTPLWSPWFRIITERLLQPCWKDLDVAMKTDKYVDCKSIHRFDPLPENFGGAGHAGPHLDAVFVAEQAVSHETKRQKLALEEEHKDLVMGVLGRGQAQTKVGAEDVKQGAYGKVPTHKHSKLDQLSRPFEVVAALRFKFLNTLENNMAAGGPDVAFCASMLDKVSRSFAAVIKQLPPCLCVDIAVFYLVLRALDTVEDDMEAYKGREEEKQTELRSFGAKRLSDVNMSIDGVGAGDERTLLQQFGSVARVYNALPRGSQDVIRDITDQMGAGMAEYVSADLAQGTEDQAAYDRYCHMVAGLVGEGLTRIFLARGCEAEDLAGQGELTWPFCADPKKQPANLGIANSMGLFLQKTNIIRDYLEDYVDGRAFWPKTTWQKYALTSDLGEFARPSAHGAGVRLQLTDGLNVVAAKGVGVQALLCLNDLVADALELTPDCLEYLNRLKTPEIYRFCAIPQVMAIATLTECFDNPNLFTGVVKIRKGLTVRLIQACIDGNDDVHWWFNHFAKEIAAKVDARACAGADGPIGKRLAKACSRLIGLTSKSADAVVAKQNQQKAVVISTVMMGVAAVAYNR
jgi:farnesyl-diphosphate farnesyltransferase